MRQEDIDVQMSEEDLEEIRKSVESEVEAADKENLKRCRLGRSDRDVPDLWKSYYYLRNGYHLEKKKTSNRGHWQGGPVQHKGAKCSVCKRSLRLVWDINCNDSRFCKESSPVFQGLERLPLYYCFDCPSPTIYRCTKPDKITVLPTERASGEESPFEKASLTLPRRPLGLKPIPSQIENLVIISEQLGADWLKSKDRAILRKYFGRHYFNYRRSQFGGIPVSEQGHQRIQCPNSRCPTHKWGHP